MYSLCPGRYLPAYQRTNKERHSAELHIEKCSMASECMQVMYAFVAYGEIDSHWDA